MWPPHAPLLREAPPPRVPRRDSTCVIPLFRYVFGETSKTQVWFFKFTGFVLWFLALLRIAPIGLLALALSHPHPYPHAHHTHTHTSTSIASVLSRVWALF